MRLDDRTDILVELFYNDYAIESPGTENTAATSLVKTITAHGAIINGTEFESHFSMSEYPTTTQPNQAVAAPGVDILSLNMMSRAPTCRARRRNWLPKRWHAMTPFLRVCKPRLLPE